MQERSKSERYNVFIKEIETIALNSNNNKRMQSIDLTETYTYWMDKNLLCNKKKIKCNNIIEQ